MQLNPFCSPSLPTAQEKGKGCVREEFWPTKRSGYLLLRAREGEDEFAAEACGNSSDSANEGEQVMSGKHFGLRSIRVTFSCGQEKARMSSLAYGRIKIIDGRD